MTWDGESRLTRLELPDGTTEENVYRADGLRHKHVDSGGTIHPIWDDRNVLLEKNADLATQAIYTQLPGIWGGAFSFKRGATHYYLLPDLQGHTRQTVNASETLLASYFYDAWGREVWPIVGGGLYLRPFGQWGYWRDTASRLYVRARHLLPELGRWMSRDPIGFGGGDWDVYGYVGARPTTGADPSGAYVVLIRGGTGRPASMLKLAAHIQTTYGEAVFQPTYDWSSVGPIPRPTPPGPDIATQVLRQIYSWLASHEGQGSDPCGIWVYGHSYGGHVAGQILNRASGFISYWLDRIELEFHACIRNVVTSVGNYRGYPQHFRNVRYVLYTLAGDPDPIAQDSAWLEPWPNRAVWWFQPHDYNSRGLNRVRGAAVQQYWFSGGRDRVIEAPYQAPPHFKHGDFDGSQGLCEQATYALFMHRFVARHLMEGHP